VERRLFHSETFGDVFQSLALNATKVSKKFAHHRQQFRFRRHSPFSVSGDPLPLFNNEAGGGDDPSMYLQPLAVRALDLLQLFHGRVKLLLGHSHPFFSLGPSLARLAVKHGAGIDELDAGLPERGKLRRPLPEI
jgi:hypothetical protein